MCAQTTDPACATPWANLTLDQQKEFIKSVGGRVAAADYILSGRAGGGSQNRERNRRIRETHLQGRNIDHDHDDLSTSAAPKATVSRGGPARAFDKDAWAAILLCYPDDAADRDILFWSAKLGAGKSKAIGVKVGRTDKRVRQIQDKIQAWSRTHLTREQILYAQARVVEFDIDGLAEPKRRLLSKAGRKRKKVTG
ncbi:MAG: hypothetical protein M0Z85_08925 [Gammaproteobacteria bacterium]|nr:hypothetical protein [Gammaproteobacteria bacterium]